MQPAILTFDLGTTRLKVALFTRRGRLLAQGAERHVDFHTGQRRWQDADAWWATAIRLARTLLTRHRVTVSAISLSGRGGAAVFIGANGSVLAQPWSDARHVGELRDLASWRRDGAHLSNYAMALLAKKQWLLANEPQLARGLRHVLYAKDFLLFRLTGQAITDPSSGPDALHWDARALDRTHTSLSQVPQPRLPWELAGGLTPAAARALALPAGTPVAVGAHDGICANVGAGAGSPGACAITLGTHAVVRMVSMATPAGAYRFYGMPQDRHVIGGNAILGGRAADWFLDVRYGAADKARTRHFRNADRSAAAVPAGARGVCFLPFLAGQVAPEARPDAAAAFAGLRADHDAAVLFRAVLEGSAFAIAAIFEQVRAWCGEPTSIRLTGSGAQSAVWRHILANVLARRLLASDGSVEGRGAAIFAAVALGWHGDHDEAAHAMVPIRHVDEPDAGTVAAYARARERWQRVADALRPLDAAR